MLFLFLDGVGLGVRDKDVNPFVTRALPAFERLSSGQPWTAEATLVRESAHVFRPIDACLGVEGLPQSGTGQAALFTGVNCPKLAGRHYGPYPHSANRDVIARQNIFAQVKKLALSYDEPAAFANAYPPRFFTMASRRDRWTVTTRCCLDAGVCIRTVDDVRDGHALTAELTGTAWRERLGLDVPVLTEHQAGVQLAHLARRHALLLFEFFLTDKAGHSRSFERAGCILHAVDRFLSGILSAIDPEATLLVLTSDHGNVEDLSTKSHTRNAVPLVAAGPGAIAFAGVNDLTGVTPAIVDVLDAGGSRSGETGP